MRFTVKKWDLSDTDQYVDVPNLVPNFGEKYFETIRIRDKSDLNNQKDEEIEGKCKYVFLDKSEETCFSNLMSLRVKDIIAQTIRWQLAKRRSGNSSTKTRSEVSGTTRKPWGQKETGRARQGSLRAPHFRGGGIVFGPHPRSYEYKLNKKFRKLALGLILNEKIKDNDLIVLSAFDSEIYKTKDFSKWLVGNGLQSVLFVGDMPEVLKKSFANIYGVDTIPLMGLNVLSCVKHKNIVFDLNSMKELLARYSNDMKKGVQNA